MNPRFEPPSLHLQPRQPLRLRVSAGQHVTSASGTTWVTQDGDPRDIILVPGDSHAFERSGRVMIQALGGDAQLVVEEGVELARDGWREVLRRATGIGARLG